MKNIFTLLILLITFVPSNGQAFTGETKIKSMNKMAVIYEMPFAAEITADAVKKKMSQLGYTNKDEKDFIAFKNVVIPSLGPGTYNLYFKTERRSKKEQDHSTVYMLLTDKYDAFLNETRDIEVINSAKTFLNSLSVQAEDVYVESEIAKHEEAVKKVEKDYNNSVEDGASLEKKRVNLEEDIKKNKEQQEQRRLETEKQKQLLLNARAKRKA